jgi:hypothetical protein
VRVVLNSISLSSPILQKAGKVLPPLRMSLNYDESLAGQGIRLQHIDRESRSNKHKSITIDGLQPECGSQLHGKVFSNLLP